VPRRTESIAASYFEDLYASDPDPWRFATSAYEAEKYAATLAALTPGRFADGLEVGCSIGVLTAKLAQRCERLLALDVSDTALSQARLACPEVRFEKRQIPNEWPTGRFDLIVFSEVLYYLDLPAIQSTALKVMESLKPAGCVVLVHYLGETDYPTTGDDAVSIFSSATGLKHGIAVGAKGYRIDRFDAEPLGQ
jgi:SAM-dependent methyltransferase